MPALPTGTVTFLFTDIEGSTRLLQELGDRYVRLIADHHRLLRFAFTERGGREVQDHGDGFYYSFSSARAAVQAAVAAQRAILAHPWPGDAVVRVRMGLHTGEPIGGETGLVGLDIHRAARICVAGHGAQILLSQTTRDLVEDHPPDGVVLRNLGDHRLKDLARPVRLYQVVASGLPVDFPSLRSLDAMPNNLPVQLTTFIGREKEMAEVTSLLTTTRLLTLAGIGGSGKTRLALQVVADVLDLFPDGVWLAELASVTDAALVPQTVASALTVQEEPRRPLTATLADCLVPKQTLIVLDSCEHLITACAHLVDALLHACPKLRILATSREALGIAGETVYGVGALSLPDPQHPQNLEAVRRSDAVSLFLYRASAARPGFQINEGNAPAIAQTCQRLDGLPLAIELAAARIRVLTPEEIAVRLDDRFRLLSGGSRAALPRHQTLLAAMDWSYGLLSDKERALLRRLSIFAGGFTLDAVEGVCTHEVFSSTEALDLLTHLVDKSLVIAEGQDGLTRYRLLETVRQYARDRLLETGEERAIRDRHLDWFLNLGEQAKLAFTGPDYEVWLDRLDRDLDNIRAALHWSRDTAPEKELRLAGSVAWLWNHRGQTNEGRQWLEDALNRHPAPVSARLLALWWAGNLANQAGDIERIATVADEYHALAKRLQDREHEARSLDMMGDAPRARGDYLSAFSYYEQSLAVARELGLKHDTASALRDLGELALDVGDYGRAAHLLEESIALYRDIGNAFFAAWALMTLGRAVAPQGDYGRAQAFLEESLVLHRRFGARRRTAMNLCYLAFVVRLCGDYGRARILAEESVAIARDIGLRRTLGWGLYNLALVARDEANFVEASSLLEQALAMGRALGYSRISAQREVGVVAIYQRNYGRAARDLGEALAAFRARGAKEDVGHCLRGRALLAHRQDDLERAERFGRESVGLFFELGHAEGLCEGLELLASVAVARRQPDRAARLFGATESARKTIGYPLRPYQRAEYDTSVGALRGALGEEGAITAWDEGHRMTFEQAVTYVLKPVSP